MEIMNEINISINWESVKGKIFLRLVNYKKNKEDIERIAYIKYLDLAILFYCDCREWGRDGFYVNKKQILMWNQNIKGIFQTALENTCCKDNTLVTPIMSFFQEELASSAQYERDIMIKEKGMMVLTNQSLSFGAAMLLNIPELKRLADRLDSDLYLLPSSIHEILAILPNQNIDVSHLTKMVNEVNNEVVGQEDYLSDHVYYFDREKCEVTIAVPA